MIQLGARQSEQLRDDGIAQAAQSRSGLLRLARQVARELSLSHGETNSDQVAAALEMQSIDSTALGNAAGAIFRGKGWTFVRYIKSVRLSRHANKIGVWKFNPQS
jgi:hypothetical protein